MNGLAFVLGTRPEIIKLSPLIRAAREAGLAPVILHSGQHFTESMDQAFFRELELPAPDHHLGVGSLPPAVQVGKVLEGLDPLLARLAPPLVVVQGDTNTTLAGAVAAKKRAIPLAHVEAGLRSGDRSMPEEQNRIVADHLAEFLFCPTQRQASILQDEGISSSRVHVVGNTIADAVARRRAAEPGTRATLDRFGVTEDGYALLTLHRQENVDDADVLRGIFAGLRLATADWRSPVLWPVHPRTRARLDELRIPLPERVRTVPPISFLESLHLQSAAKLVLTDSGGLQEEAAILNVPCVTLRTSTERPETIEIGANVLAGVTPEGIVTAIATALASDRKWAHPYGDGCSAERILEVLRSAVAPAGPGTRGASGSAGAVPGPVQLPSDGDHTGRDLGDEEIAFVSRAIRSGTLNSTRGTWVTRFEKEFAAAYGVPHAIACASGTAAVHCAVAALKPPAGGEIVTTAITDMGALTPILYEGAVPVFCDVDPDTFNVTAATIEARLTERTCAIVVTHLFGMPCDMGPILELAASRGIPVIEDCAQAFLATSARGRVGTLGAISCFSMQQGKHMTTGEGGIVTTADPELARRVFLFVNKAWGYGDPKPDHYFPALNYRLTELQGAVAVAQLQKLDSVVRRRRESAAKLTRMLAGSAGLGLPVEPPETRHVYWKYPLRVDASVIRGGAVELGKRLKERGVSCVPRYIQKPAFQCALFADWSSSPVTSMPLRGNPPPVWRREDFPGTFRALEHVLVLPWNERYTDAHLAFLETVIREETEKLSAHGS